MIKTIKSHEKVVFLRKMLPGFKDRVQSGDSMLVRIYGMYMLCVGSYSINLVVMENILYGTEASLLKFDLKGSRYRRKVMKHNKPLLTTHSRVFKDVDFENSLAKLYLSKPDIKRLNALLAHDVAYLQSQGVMDYSLSVSLSRGQVDTASKSKYFFKKTDSDSDFYMIALIDFMQDFDARKRIESCFKRYVKRVPAAELSSVEPVAYARRFLNYVNGITMNLD